MNDDEELEVNQKIAPSLSKKNQVLMIKEFIAELGESHSYKKSGVPFDAIKIKIIEEGLEISDMELERYLDILIQDAEIYRPPNGGYRAV